MPPSAAPEWLRVGWIFEISGTSAPASCASIAARMPAQPAPTTRTSCFASTTEEAIESGLRSAAVRMCQAEPPPDLLDRRTVPFEPALQDGREPLLVRLLARTLLRGHLPVATSSPPRSSSS